MANSKKKCKHCKQWQKAETMITVPGGTFCGTDHAIQFAQSKVIQKRVANNLADAAISRLKPKRKNKKITEQSKPALAKKAKDLAQLYARIRDKNLSCITCDKDKDWHGVWEGAHFISSTHSFTRLNVLNINKACRDCNNYKTDRHHAAYPAALRLKIGDVKVDYLIENKHTQKRYSKDYLIKYIRVARKAIKRMEARN